MSRRNELVIALQRAKTEHKWQPDHQSQFLLEMAEDALEEYDSAWWRRLANFFKGWWKG